MVEAHFPMCPLPSATAVSTRLDRSQLAAGDPLGGSPTGSRPASENLSPNYWMRRQANPTGYPPTFPAALTRWARPLQLSQKPEGSGPTLSEHYHVLSLPRSPSLLRPRLPPLLLLTPRLRLLGFCFQEGRMRCKWRGEEETGKEGGRRRWRDWKWSARRVLVWVGEEEGVGVDGPRRRS